MIWEHFPNCHRFVEINVLTTHSVRQCLLFCHNSSIAASEAGPAAASDYVPIFSKCRSHCAGVHRRVHALAWLSQLQRFSTPGPSVEYIRRPCSMCTCGRVDSPSGQPHLDPPRQACVSSNSCHPVWGNPRGRERRGSPCGRWPNPAAPSLAEEGSRTQSVSTKSEFQIIDRSDTAMSDRPFHTSRNASLPSCRILSVRNTVA
jgi:hypothetical protein